MGKMKIRVIPAIDLLSGKCVRLTRGDYASGKVYDASPLDVAKRLEDCGIGMIHLVDLDGARASSPVNLPVLEGIKSSTGLEVEFGGGVKSSAALASVLGCGADYVIGGSVAVTDPGLLGEWLETYPGRIVLGVDIRDGKVATRGWLDDSPLSYRDVMGRFPSAPRAVITEISRDGTLRGVDTAFYRKVQSEFPGMEVTVSGGIGCVDDILSLQEAGLGSVIVGKALYEGRISLDWLSRHARGTS